jgi:hypothetical protein
MTMRKKTLFTVMGIALSFAIAAGSWALTSTLIDWKSNTLLSMTGFEQVPFAEPIDTGQAQVRLSVSKMTEVLRSWEEPGEEIMHEPVTGQLTIEQAIHEAKAGLSYFEGFPLIALLDDAYQTSAYLSYKASRRSTEIPDPAYSCWTVTFSGRDTSATMVLNAVTGQIWSFSIQPLSYEVDWTAEMVENALAMYLSYLEFAGNEQTEASFNHGRFLSYVPIEADNLYAACQGIGKPVSDDKTKFFVQEFRLFLTWHMPNYSVEYDALAESFEN